MPFLAVGRGWHLLDCNIFCRKKARYRLALTSLVGCFVRNPMRQDLICRSISIPSPIAPPRKAGVGPFCPTVNQALFSALTLVVPLALARLKLPILIGGSRRALMAITCQISVIWMMWW